MPKKQIEFQSEGMERASIKEIEAAADRYVAIRDKRMQLTESEVVAKNNLIAALEKHKDQLSPTGKDGQLCYTYEDEVVLLTPVRVEVKVKKAKSADESDED